MRIELILSPVLYDGRVMQSHHATVAVDVLRATSSICAAFMSGAESVVPLDSLEPLQEYLKKGYTVAAERNGKKLPGAECGNSPTEYMSMNLTGKHLAYSTTNGTVSIIKARNSDRLYVGAFANLTALAEKIMSNSLQDLVILCSGWKGDPSIEDTLFAGALIDKLQHSDIETVLINDAAMMAVDLWNSARGDVYGYCSKATHVHRLRNLDYERDIRWAFQLDSCPVVPVYNLNNNSLVLC